MNRGLFSVFSGRYPAGGAAGLAPIWESPDTGALALSTNFSWTHGLGFKPKLFTFGIRCLTADGNYAVGYEIDRVSCVDTLGLTQPMVAFATSSLIGIYSAADTSFQVQSGTPSTAKALTVASWRPFARIFG